MRPVGAIRPLKKVTIRALIPNMMTIMAMCAGLTAIRFAIHGQWKAAVIAVVIAGVIDGLDGNVARLLKASSRFGAELDSLADVVNFGVVPALLLYLWTLGVAKPYGWVATLTYAVCMALRLARFNSRLDDEDEPKKRAGFFTGVPAPMAAGLALTPMMVSFEFGVDFRALPGLVALNTFVVAILMVSTFATFSLKKVLLKKEAVVPTLVIVALTVILLVVEPWKVMIFLSLLYAVMIPVGHMRWLKLSKAMTPKTPDAGSDA